MSGGVGGAKGESESQARKRWIRRLMLKNNICVTCLDYCWGARGGGGAKVCWWSQRKRGGRAAAVNLPAFLCN